MVGCLGFLNSPEEKWISLRTRNIIERLNWEFKRRMRSIEIVSREQFCYHLPALISLKVGCFVAQTQKKRCATICSSLREYMTIDILLNKANWSPSKLPPLVNGCFQERQPVSSVKFHKYACKRGTHCEQKPLYLEILIRIGSSFCRNLSSDKMLLKAFTRLFTVGYVIFAF